MTYGNKFKLANLFNAKIVNLSHHSVNNGYAKPENWYIIHLVSYDVSLSRTKQSSNGQLLYWSGRFGIFDESHQYNTKNSVGWQIVMNPRIEINLEVTATPGFRLLIDCCDSDDVAVLRCTWRSRGCYGEGKAWCLGNEFCSEEFHVCHLDWQ